MDIETLLDECQEYECEEASRLIEELTNMVENERELGYLIEELDRQEVRLDVGDVELEVEIGNL